MKYAGADWLAHSYPEKRMSAHGRAVADLVGQAWQGLYHLPRTTLRRLDLSHEENIEVLVPDGMATYDGRMLTRLVVLAHDRCMRLEIAAARNGILRLWFSKRERWADTSYYRHPTLEQNVEAIRAE